MGIFRIQRSFFRRLLSFSERPKLKFRKQKTISEDRNGHFGGAVGCGGLRWVAVRPVGRGVAVGCGGVRWGAVGRDGPSPGGEIIVQAGRKKYFGIRKRFRFVEKGIIPREKTSRWFIAHPVFGLWNLRRRRIWPRSIRAG